MPELIPYLAFVLFKIPLPLTVIQILAVDLGTDMLPALALGAEKPEAGSMQKPPRSPAERLVDLSLLVRSYLFLGLLEAGAAIAAFFFVLNVGGWLYGQPLAANDPLYFQATTACLSAIVVMQVANVFFCRSERVFAFGFFSNRLILAGIAVELVLISLIVYTPASNHLFGTAPLASTVWLPVVPFAAAMLPWRSCGSSWSGGFGPRCVRMNAVDHAETMVTLESPPAAGQPLHRCASA